MDVADSPTVCDADDDPVCDGVCDGLGVCDGVRVDVLVPVLVGVEEGLGANSTIGTVCTALPFNTAVPTTDRAAFCSTTVAPARLPATAALDDE